MKSDYKSAAQFTAEKQASARALVDSLTQNAEVLRDVNHGQVVRKVPAGIIKRLWQATVMDDQQK